MTLSREKSGVMFENCDADLRCRRLWHRLLLPAFATSPAFHETQHLKFEVQNFASHFLHTLLFAVWEIFLLQSYV